MKEDRLKLFAMSNQMLDRDLDKIEEKLEINLCREISNTEDKDDQYYPQFAESIRHEASRMGEHYELFYCLEKSIRSLIQEKLRAEKGAKWWEDCVPSSVKNNVDANIKKERDNGFTPRSSDEIDYSNFGELGEIVRSNWDTFGDTFNSQKAFNKVMANLNQLRAPIAHCSPLADDEVVRLRITLKDWFRLME